MKNITDSNNSSKTSRGMGTWFDQWRWLIEPSPSIAEPERRLQARLLMAMLLVLLILGILSVILTLADVYARPAESRTITSIFIWVTVAGVLLIAIEYGLSRTTNYPLAALLVVGTVLGATFMTVIVNPQDLRSLSFLVLGGLIGSLFLSARTTAIVFSITFLGLWLLPLFVSGFSLVSILNALFFILTVGALVVMATSLRQRNLDQIHSQTRQLRESEARLRDLSIRDPLTGLFNRRYLEEVLALELIRAARKAYPVGIIMADIDHFKRINDTYGHATGDAVLVQISNFLCRHVRASDASCRYGGEEFILILTEASREITQMRVEHMREDIRNLRVQFEGQTLEASTLSMGVAMFPLHGSTNDDLLKAADDASIALNVTGVTAWLLRTRN